MDADFNIFSENMRLNSEFLVYDQKEEELFSLKPASIEKQSLTLKGNNMHYQTRSKILNFEEGLEGVFTDNE